MTNEKDYQAFADILQGLSDYVCKQNKIGKIKKLDESEVPSQIPIYDELRYIYDKSGDEEADFESKSLTYLLLYSGTPYSSTHGKNPFVKHTKSTIARTLDGDKGAPVSSRELELSIKIIKSSEILRPKDVFKMALEITNGDVSSALLT
ncbi:MAG: hypothetical protein ACP5D6_10170 [Kosmotogaceae bacterium]